MFLCFDVCLFVFFAGIVVYMLCVFVCPCFVFSLPMCCVGLFVVVFVRVYVCVCFLLCVIVLCKNSLFTSTVCFVIVLLCVCVLCLCVFVFLCVFVCVC